jgi:alkylation response protein AidB-like acyl-CoA dehydrogenase
MDFHHTREELEFIEEFRDWLSDHFTGEFLTIKGVGGVCDDTHWDLRLEWEKLLARDRWLNLSWPVEYGGRGGTYAQEVLFQLEHARVDAPYWLGSQGRDLFGPTLLSYGKDEHKERFLPKIAAAEEFWGQGFSEPEAGSDLANLRTRAELDGDEWVINGQKIWTTFGTHADWLYVLCKTDPNAPRHKAISMLMVPVDQPGVDVRAIRNISGGREFAEVFFTDARTKADLVVGPVNGGWGVVMGTLGNERGGTTVIPFQASFHREMRDALAVARTRGLDRDPLWRQRLAKAWGDLRVLDLLIQRNLTPLLRGGHPGAESSILKIYWSFWHRQMGELRMDLVGADANVLVDGELSLAQRVFLDARAETIYGGSAEVQRNIVGERVLGLPR